MMLFCCDSDYVIFYSSLQYVLSKRIRIDYCYSYLVKTEVFLEYQGRYFEMRNIGFLSSEKVSFFSLF